MTEQRAQAYLGAVFLLVIGGVGIALEGVARVTGVGFVVVGALRFMVARRASDEALERLHRRWFINPWDLWRAVRGR